MTDPAAPVVATTQTPAPEPTDPPAAPAADPLAGIDTMTPEQLEQIAARVNTARQNRPPSIAQQLAAIQADLAGAGAQLPKAIEARQEAKGDVQALESKLEQLTATLRRAEIVEAATAAGFKTPAVIADHLARADGDVVELVTKLAATGAFQMAAPQAAPSAQIGGKAGTDPTPDAARQALFDEINRAHGRS